MAKFIYSSKSGFSLPDLTIKQSTIDVYGVTGGVKSVSVGIEGFHHTHAQDLDMLLVAPDKLHNLAFMSDAGGTDFLSGVSFGFSDSAAAQMAQTAVGAIASGGQYLPTDYLAN